MSSGRPSMLINLPPPPSDPATPNDAGPSTPNSTTTSLSTLSVVAIKDGAVGHGGRGSGQSANTLEAERADRISRLAGLERVATVRAPPSGNMLPQFRERSTVGSASATGSVGGRTTWASESVDNDPDKMSEEQDETSSIGGFSDTDKASLVGFGEGANSTVSGPISTASARTLAARQGFVSPNPQRSSLAPSNSGQSTPMSGVMPTGVAGSVDPKMTDGVPFDQNVVDSTLQSPQPASQGRAGNRFSGAGVEMAQNIISDRLDERDSNQAMGTPDSHGLGKFSFERDV